MTKRGKTWTNDELISIAHADFFQQREIVNQKQHALTKRSNVPCITTGPLVFKQARHLESKQ